MSRIKIIAVAAWSAALVSAGALAYVLNADAPQPVASSIDSVPNEPLPSTPLVEAAMHPETGIIIVLPTTVVAAPVHRKAAPPTPARARKLSEMTCSGWRPLEQGDRSQQVRSCD